MQHHEIRDPKQPKTVPAKTDKPPLVQPIVAESSVILQHQCQTEIPSDVDGSYTGTPIDGGQPIQDADDL